MKSRCHILVIFIVKRSSVLKKKIFFRVINFEEDYRFKIMHNFFFKSDYLLQIFHFIFTSMWQEKPFYIITSCLLTNFFQGIAEIVKLLNDFLLLRKNVVLLLVLLLGLKMTFFTTLHGAAVSGYHTLLQFHKKRGSVGS